MSTPILKYQNYNIELTDLKAPVYPNKFSDKSHSIRSIIPEYGNMRRRYGTTKHQLNFKDLTKSDYQAIYNFWTTRLNYGIYQGSYIDDKSRVLFHASISNWKHKWKRKNGGRWDLSLLAESPFLISPKSLAMFFCFDNGSTFSNFNLLPDKSISLNTASLVAKSVVNAGYYMCEFQVGTNPKGGACNTNCSYDFLGDSFTLFCQYRVGSMGSAAVPLSLFSIDNYSQTAYNEQIQVNIYGGDGTDHYIVGNITTAGVTTTTPTILHNRRQWYDAALTYDAISKKLYLYTTKNSASDTSHPAATDDFIDYLIDANPITAQLTSINLDNYNLQTGTRVYFNTDFVAGNSLQAGEPIRAMNHMIFNDFITPYEFNNLRYLCYVYNTQGEFPK